MTVPHYRITEAFGPYASARHFDFSTHELAEALAYLAKLAALVADDSLSPRSVSFTNLALVAEDKA